MRQISKQVLLLCLLAFFAASSGATIISGSATTSGGKTVALQGLEWLSLHHSRDLSRTEIESAAGWTDAEGTTWAAGEWRYATRSETETLINSLWGGTYDGWSPDNADGALWFLDVFGGLSFDIRSGVFGTYTDGDLNSTVWRNLDGSTFFYGSEGECGPTGVSCRGRVDGANNYTFNNISGINVATGVTEVSYVKSTGSLGYFRENSGGDFGLTTDNLTLLNTSSSRNYGSMLVRNTATAVPVPPMLFVLLVGLCLIGVSRPKLS